MRYTERLVRQVSWCLVVTTLLFLGDASGVQAQQAQAQNQNGATAQQTGKPASADAASSVAMTNEAAISYPDAPVPQDGQNPNQSGQSASSQSSSAQTPVDDQNKDVRPLGTAAAPSAQPSGVTGSRPAGAVIAPGKQRRTHAILISVALVAGAAIAVGTVAALSHGTPSRP
jgi:hypothetical protein